MSAAPATSAASTPAPLAGAVQAREPRGRGWPELWRHRELLRLTIARDLRVRYRGLAIGCLWTLLQPLLMLAVLLLVFGRIVPVKLPHYWAFLLSGFFAWNFLGQSIGASAHLLHQRAGLARGAAFPLSILVLGPVLARAAEFAIELALVALLLGLGLHGALPASFALLPLLLLLLLLLALGLTLPLAVLGVLVQDVRQGLPIAVTLLFYAAPVFYPESAIAPPWQGLYLANPIAGLLSLYHCCLYEAAFPPLPLLVCVAAQCIAAFGLGHAVFERYERSLPELL